jgi:hypothetical protein
MALASISAPLLLCLAGCGSANDAVNDGRPEAPSGPKRPLPALCSRPGDDPVRDLFCADKGAVLTGLEDLEDALRIPFDSDSTLATAFLGHSTSLSGRLVSPINPRVITASFGEPQFHDATFLAFARGEQRVEMAAQDRSRDVPNFYLVTFAQACNETPAGCLPGDLYTPAVETSWERVDIRDDEDLKDTSLDCRQCHERARQTPMLLMRELQSPWAHFFEKPLDMTALLSFVDFSGGMTLELEYRRAKGDEPYANVAWPAIQNTGGNTLQLEVEQA